MGAPAVRIAPWASSYLRAATRAFSTGFSPHNLRAKLIAIIWWRWFLRSNKCSLRAEERKAVDKAVVLGLNRQHAAHPLHLLGVLAKNIADGAEAGVSGGDTRGSLAALLGATTQD